MITCNNRIGANLISLRKFDSSKLVLNRSLALGADHQLMQSKEIATTMDNLGVYYGQIDQLDSSLYFLRKGLAKRRQIYGVESVEAAQSISGLGWIYSKKKDYDSALYYLEKALAIGKKYGKRDDPLITDCYLNLAYNHANLGDYDRALLYMHEVHEIWDQDSLADHPGLLHIYLNMGNYYLRLKKHKEALDWSSKILSKKYNDQTAIYRAHAHLNVASCYEQTMPEEALKNYRSALKILDKIYGAKSKSIAVTYNAMADFSGERHDFDSAFYYAQRAKTMIEDIFGSKSLYLAQNFNIRSEIYFNQKNWLKALESSQQAIIISSKDFSKKDFRFNPGREHLTQNKELLQALILKGKALQASFKATADLKMLRLALESYLVALEMVNSIKETYTFDGSKFFLGESSLDVYHGAMQCAVELNKRLPTDGFASIAFRIAEENRANVLLSDFQKLKAQGVAGIPQEILAKEKELRLDQEYFMDKIRLEEGKKSPDLKAQEKFKRKYFQTKTDYDALMRRLEQDYPRYYELKAQSEVASLMDVQDHLRKDEILLEYFLTDEMIYLFSISRETFDIVEVKLGSSIDKEVGALLGAINKFDKKRFTEYAARLYNKLVKPAGANLNNTGRLIIIPHNELAFVPFDCLMDTSRNGAAEHGRYLIEDYEVVHHYSATLFTKKFHHPTEGKSVVAFAPVENFSSLTPSGPSELPALPASLEEAMDIKSLEEEGTDMAVIFVNQDATETNFRNFAKNYPFVHLATHTMVEDTNGGQGSIRFRAAEAVDNSVSDGVLTLAETYNLELKAKLVVLSSCESGLGTLIKGEGALSLTRGLYYSGAQQVICTLWKVNDQLTRKFMSDFYNNMGLNQALIPAGLRSAKLEALAQPETSFPKHWAGFVLIGN